MSERKSSPTNSPSQGNIKDSRSQCNSNKYQYFLMLQRIKEERLYPNVQIDIANSIIKGLDKMGKYEFFQFEYKRFIEEISNYDWKNQVLAEYLEHCIKKILRIKYIYIDVYEQQIYKQPNRIEQSVRSEFTFGKRSATSDTFDQDSIMLQSAFQSPQSTPQRISIASSQCKLDEEETKNMFANCLTQNSQSMLQEQQDEESKVRNSQNSMSSSSAHKL